MGDLNKTELLQDLPIAVLRRTKAPPRLKGPEIEREQWWLSELESEGREGAAFQQQSSAPQT